MVAAIFASIGFARTLVEQFPARHFIDNAFFTGFLLILAAVVIQAFRKRRGGIEIGVILAVACAYFLVFLRMGIPAERSHLIEYTVVALLIYEALKERKFQDAHVPFPPLLAILATSLIGVIDECIQLFIPDRVFDARDILFNFLASVMAVGGSLAIEWARGKTGGSG